MPGNPFMKIRVQFIVNVFAEKLNNVMTNKGLLLNIHCSSRSQSNVVSVHRRPNKRLKPAKTNQKNPFNLPGVLKLHTLLQVSLFNVRFTLHRIGCIIVTKQIQICYIDPNMLISLACIAMGNARNCRRFPPIISFRPAGNQTSQEYLDTFHIQSYNMTMKTINAAKFKEQCLSLLEMADDEEILITKRGRPVAKLIGLKNQSSALIGSLKHKIKIQGDLISTGLKWDAES